MALEHHERALALQVPHEARHAHLGRDADQHVHVVRHQVPLVDLDALVPAERAQDLAHVLAVLAVDYLSPILRREHDAVLAHPLRVRQAVGFPGHSLTTTLLGRIPWRPEQSPISDGRVVL